MTDARIEPGHADTDHTEPGHIELSAVTLSEEFVSSDVPPSPEVAEYALWLGDDALVLAQRLGGWITRAPELEEDVALANIALDLLGHARSLLRYAGAASGRTEDDLAYWREEGEFRSAHLFEQPNGDFAHTIVRQFAAAHYLYALYDRLRASTDPVLAGVAAKAVKEVDYHRDHADQWMLRLALGTDESRRRTLRAMEDVWPYVDELFSDASALDADLFDALEGVAVRPSSLRAAFDADVAPILAEAELTPPDAFHAAGGGRRGRHSEHLAPLLAELQVLARQHPGASW
ncbi:1,2-phenylacetyl-CoA epoxidase subunit PaaC [Leifsonia shinshuensis]|uniref:1,2-phenylacetyl-CoA epoxidase subunit PaaC n=1 Tax=Leifsonia shinshuensis TaxID=150026 RepID=UPI00286459AA|nr:1,2-phenylacetyl-CoA epoxidase subunit PaaC [Leifsonia shinshuensis]MDR6971305.1 ring-1,2-phenylacetyl-CoA epoxidase subunit PaaC [Leifsonia shinshuensis]